MIQDMAAVEGLTWINKVFVAHNVQEVCKEVPAYLIHNLYNGFL